MTDVNSCCISLQEAVTQAAWHRLMLPLCCFQLANGSCSVLLTVFSLHYSRFPLFKSYSWISRDTCSEHISPTALLFGKVLWNIDCTCKVLEEFIIMLQAPRPIPMAHWLTSVCYITSSKAYLQEEGRFKQLDHLCICLCFPHSGIFNPWVNFSYICHSDTGPCNHNATGSVRVEG